MPEDQQRGEPENEYATALSYGRAEDDRWLVRKDDMRVWVNGVLTALRTETGKIAGFAENMRFVYRGDQQVGYWEGE